MVQSIDVPMLASSDEPAAGFDPQNASFGSPANPRFRRRIGSLVAKLLEAHPGMRHRIGNEILQRWRHRAIFKVHPFP